MIRILFMFITWILTTAFTYTSDDSRPTIHVFCGDMSMGAFVVVNSNHTVAASATCLSDYTEHFVQYDNHDYVMSISYKDSSSAGCVFNRIGDVCSIAIYIQWTTYRTLPVKEVYVIKCIESNNVIVGNVSRPFIRSTDLPTVTKMNQRQFSKRLFLVDVNDRIIKGAKVRSEKTVKLVALFGHAVNQGSESHDFDSIFSGLTVGHISPVSCDAVGATYGRRYAILRSGCGDGLVFRQSDGFSVKKNSAESSYFKLFHVFGDDKITFECSFTVCKNCENSCTKKTEARPAMATLWNHFMHWIAKPPLTATGKRSIPDTKTTVYVKTPVFRLQETKLETIKSKSLILKSYRIDYAEPNCTQRSYQNSENEKSDKNRKRNLEQKTKIAFKTGIHWTKKVVWAILALIYAILIIVLFMCCYQDTRRARTYIE